MSDDPRDRLVATVRQLYPAYEIYISAGAGAYHFSRHIWPVFLEIRGILHEIDVKKISSQSTDGGERFAIGLRNNDGSYGMIAGLFLTLEEATVIDPYVLEPLGEQRPAFIFYFPDASGNHEIIAEWRDGEWIASEG